MPYTKKVQLGILGLLIIGFIFTVSSAFAYWQEVTVSNTVDVIVIRDGAELIIDDLNDHMDEQRLVPKGHRMFASDVETVEFFYNVGVSRELIDTADLHISVQEIVIGGESTYAHLVDIDIMNQGAQASTDLFNDMVRVRATVSLIEPIDEAEAIEKDLPLETVNVDDSLAAYESIKGQSIVFTLQFSLSSKEDSNNDSQ